MRSKTSFGARIGEFEKSLPDLGDGLLDFADSRAEGFEDTASSRFGRNSYEPFIIVPFVVNASGAKVLAGTFEPHKAQPTCSYSPHQIAHLE
jgi:hypothetical protein